jgi:hypothetical protein
MTGCLRKSRRWEAFEIARRLQDRVSNGTSSSTRERASIALQYGDIAILFQSTTHDHTL